MHPRFPHLGCCNASSPKVHADLFWLHPVWQYWLHSFFKKVHTSTGQFRPCVFLLLGQRKILGFFSFFSQPNFCSCGFLMKISTSAAIRRIDIYPQSTNLGVGTVGWRYKHQHSCGDFMPELSQFYSCRTGFVWLNFLAFFFWGGKGTTKWGSLPRSRRKRQALTCLETCQGLHK